MSWTPTIVEAKEQAADYIVAKAFGVLTRPSGWKFADPDAGGSIPSVPADPPSDASEGDLDNLADLWLKRMFAQLRVYHT